jgi:hypothetical protein
MHMPTYHVQFFTAPDGSSRPNEVFDCIDDSEAIAKARQFIDGHDLELRESGRFVARFSRKGSGGLNIGFELPYEMPPRKTEH